MELNKVKIHRMCEVGAAASQMTLDDDYNVPDYRPDIIKVLKEKGELRFDEVKAGVGAVWIKGSLIFRVLYRSDRSEGRISCLRGELPFQEKLNMDGLQEFTPVRVRGEMEDINIGVINSRKLNVRAVISLRATAEQEEDQELTTGVADAGEYEQNLISKELLTLLTAKKDICRQKSEIVLPSSKPNVHEILWRSVELRNVEKQIREGKALVSGEVLVSALYSEEETDRMQWFETTVPLSCSVDCEIGEEQDVCKIGVTPLSLEMEVKPDYDGEERILVLELALELDIRVWREENMEFLQDIYSLKKNVVPLRKEKRLEKLLVKNYAKCRLAEQMELPESQEKILQICACEATVNLEKTEYAENGVLAEGIVVVELLYLTTDDNMPIGTAKEIYPFSQLIEVPEMAVPLRADLETGVEQLSAVMLDQEHIEIKAVIHLDLMAFLEYEMSDIENITEEPLDMESLLNDPGLVGYIAKRGDTLWQIAKENHTTIEDIMETNGRKDSQLLPGEKILIVKQVG
ncbi:MAG: DUF3794 domain-containing protein [Clostridiales bacterium]|nr:DUF3794 domain-containing protein [Clostridiales bacterium]